jgi:DNA-binding CsgD family transcriptional regulator
VIAQALKSPEPFQWGTGLPSPFSSPEQQRPLNEAAHFGIRTGFTVPIHDGHGPIAALTFAANQREAPFEICISSHARVLQLMAIFFHAHVCRKLTDEPRIGDILLSPREFECLDWAAQGKSSWEIGCILGISRHTVASYLDSAKEKLGVRTIVQAGPRKLKPVQVEEKRSALAHANGRIAELERLVGRQQLDIDFFEKPCAPWSGRQRKANPHPHHPSHRCQSARGPDADRHAKLLIHLAVKGSILFLPPDFFTVAVRPHGTPPLRCRAASDVPGRRPCGDATSPILRSPAYGREGRSQRGLARLGQCSTGCCRDTNAV